MDQRIETVKVKSVRHVCLVCNSYKYFLENSPKGFSLKFLSLLIHNCPLQSFCILKETIKKIYIINKHAIARMKNAKQSHYSLRTVITLIKNRHFIKQTTILTNVFFLQMFY